MHLLQFFLTKLYLYYRTFYNSNECTFNFHCVLHLFYFFLKFFCLVKKRSRSNFSFIRGVCCLNFNNKLLCGLHKFRSLCNYRTSNSIVVQYQFLLNIVKLIVQNWKRKHIVLICNGLMSIKWLFCSTSYQIYKNVVLELVWSTGSCR